MAFQPKRSPFGVWTTVAVASFAILVAAGVYLYNVSVSGFELNVNTWQIRHFEFAADPFTNRQLTDVSYSNAIKLPTIPTEILSHIQGLPATGEDRWDLVEFNDFKSKQDPGPAMIFTKQLTTQWGAQETAQFWSTWSVDHPAKAAKFWPAVRELTRLQAYAFLPELFSLATTAGDDDFHDLLSQAMGQSLLQHAKQARADGDTQLAVAAAQAGLYYLPNQHEFQAILDSCKLQP